MPETSPKYTRRRRARSEVVTLLDDISFDSDVGFVGGFDNEETTATQPHDQEEEHAAADAKYYGNVETYNILKARGAKVPGDLRSYLQKKGRLSPSKALRFALDIARGMNYLHECKPDPIIHCDLRPKNILLDSGGLLKVAGIALIRLSKISPNKARLARPATVDRENLYIAPEIYKDELFNGGVDVYSFGIILYEIDQGVLVYKCIIVSNISKLNTLRFIFTLFVILLLRDKFMFYMSFRVPAWGNCILWLHIGSAVLAVGAHRSREGSGEILQLKKEPGRFEYTHLAKVKLKGVVTSGDKRGTEKVVAVSGSGIVMDLVKCDKLKGGETSGDEMRTDKVVEVRGTEKVVAVSGSGKVVEVSGSGKVVEASGSGKVMDLVKMFEKYDEFNEIGR
nr:integrin-linked protein kinase 1-like [Tanacetum cinerariifolium]